MDISQQAAEIIEYSSVAANLLFLLLLIRENIWCWLFGILGSLSGAFLFWASDLNSETLLYLFYAAVGFYGWWKWNKASTKEKPMPITDIRPRHHPLIIIGAAVLSVLLGTLMSNYTSADYPYFDSATTVFALVATFMETKKIFSGWYYWIVINFASIFLYGIKDLNIYAGLAAFYTIMSFYGLYTWKKSKSENYSDK